MSVKSRHLYNSLKNLLPDLSSLPALQNRKNACAVGVSTSSSQPASHGFLDCLVILVVVTSHAILRGSE
jgi:hypothetical protein